MNNYKDLFSLEGKTAVITGGAGLLGREMAKGLCNHGATAIIAELSPDEAQKVVDSIGKAAVAEFLDITDPESIAQLINKYDKIDIWVNNAYPRTSDWGKKFEDIPPDSWKKNVDMHLNGYFMCCQKIAAKMVRQSRGNIINMASIYGLVAPNFSVYNGTEMTMPAAYAAIKGGIINFTRYMATYLAPYKIRVNCISPGGIFDRQPASFVGAYSGLTPMGRMAEPKDIVGPLIFLASEASAYVTGQNLVVDGGWTAW